MIFTYLVIREDGTKPLETLKLDIPTNTLGDQLPNHLNRLADGANKTVELTPLKRLSSISPKDDESKILAASGVYAYYYQGTTGAGPEEFKRANIRATSLSMACGLHSLRFYGDVFISRLGYSAGENSLELRNLSIEKEEIEYASCTSPDLRREIMNNLLGHELKSSVQHPDWLLNAAKTNYEDAGSLSILASVMKQDRNEEDTICYDSSDTSSDSNHSTSYDDSDVIDIGKRGKSGGPNFSSVATMQTLCLQCRRPSKNLCGGCGGVYFCEEPYNCKALGWSHMCICKTWTIYTKRRTELSSFPFQWHFSLITEECYKSEEQYKDFLIKLGVLSGTSSKHSWWSTETDGWSGGSSSSAKSVNFSTRLSYQDGFSLETHLIPPEHRPSDQKCILSNISRDECNLLQLNSWEDYYTLRDIPLTSPVALLCTFPLSVYYAIQKFGSVPVTVARMLKRPLRIHLVGIEKELNFIDLFKEVGYLLSEDLQVEFVFIVREDMLPSHCENDYKSNEGLSYRLTANVTCIIQMGTYGSSLDPRFDCGSGPPDMLIGMNAGLYAYDSWRDVIEYLHNNSGVVGVFTDYNEHSGLNCASLGGSMSRETLCVNPFRQPRAMPVFSMNLPQFSNGFMYVYNEQELE